MADAAAAAAPGGGELYTRGSKDAPDTRGQSMVGARAAWLLPCVGTLFSLVG